jgi:protein-S-isoprenylcysteine O-methyltransferase Ste14
VDTLRYIIALALVCALPPIFLYWPIIHPFVRFWRRLGPTLTYVVILMAVTPVGVTIFWHRARILAVEFGTSWLLVALGVFCFMAAIWLRRLLDRDVTKKLLLGLPELEPERYPQLLVRTGLYARVRHPRYLQMSLGLLGCVLVANYLAGYVTWLAWLPMMYVVAVLEERELRERFGEDYERYSLEVPRFLPRVRRRGGVGAQQGDEADRP